MAGPRVRHLSILVALLLAAPAAARAQTTTTGALDLLVRDDAGVPIAGAEVVLTRLGTGDILHGTTSREGRVILLLLSPGEYTGRVEQLGSRPLVVNGIRVATHRTSRLTLDLRPAAPPVVEVDTLVVPLSRAFAAGTGRVMGERELRGNPTPQRSLADLGVLSGLTGRDLIVEGLDRGRVPLLVDGVPLATAGTPYFSAAAATPFALSSQLLTEATLSAARMDMEDPTGTGASWEVSTLPGFRRASVRTYGSVQALQAARGDASEPAGRAGGIGGGAIGGGALTPDGPAVAVGVEAWSDPARIPSVLGLADAGRIRDAARASNVDLTPFGDPFAARTQSLSGFVRVDWLGTPNSRLSTVALLSAARPDERLLSITPQLGYTAARATDLFGASTLASRIAPGLLNELRLGVTVSRRSYAPARLAGTGGATGGLLPETAIAGTGAYFGSNSRFPGEVRGTSLFASDALQLLMGDHRLKFGAQATMTRVGNDLVAGRAGRFQFGGTDLFEQHTGAFYQVSAITAADPGPTGQLSGFVQDVWTTARVEAFAGVRADYEIRPAEAFLPDLRWLRATAFLPDTAALNEVKFSPRAGIAWDVDGRGTLRLHVESGVFHEMLDPGVLTDLARGGDSASVVRWAGPVPEWPDEPKAAVARRQAALALPGLRSPRTVRTGGGITAALAPTLAVQLDLAFRHTDFLPRRRDLNRTGTPGALDVNGRPIWGALTKQGGLLLETPGSSRRFAGYDIVDGISADGSANYVGITAGLVGALGSHVTVRGSYTLSSARDNAPSAWAGTPLAAPGAGEERWLLGPSDLDVPHRATLQLDLDGPGFLRLTAQGQYRSGLPFTPGFGPEVDANADGVGGNDPAFLDETVAGYQDLARNWSCLRTVGRFAARNSCRGPAAFSLNARISFRLPGTSELYLDGYDLLGRATTAPDPVLYRVDPSTPLGADARTGRVVVPLRVNPNFGRALPDFGWGRALRIGLQLHL